MAKEEMTSRERFRAIMHFKEPDRLMFGFGALGGGVRIKKPSFVGMSRVYQGPWS